MKKLDAHGFAHILMLVLIVVGLAIVGTYFLVRSHADTVTYSCPKGGTLSGTTCSYPATYNAGSSSTYASLCNNGDGSSTYNWNNTGGYHCAHLVSNVGIYGSCPSGQYKAYLYCYTVYRPHCNTGDTISSDYSTCTHVVVAGYSCPSGGTLSGSTCSYAATATTITSGSGSGSSSPPLTYPYENSGAASTDLGRINNYRAGKGWSTLAEANCLDTIASNYAKKEATANAISDPGSTWFNNQFSQYCSGHSWLAWGANDGLGPTESDIFTAFLNSCEHLQNIADHGNGTSKVSTPNGASCSFKSVGFARVGTGAWVGSSGSVFVSQIFVRW
jgi:hypothetical protein